MLNPDYIALGIFALAMALIGGAMALALDDMLRG